MNLFLIARVFATLRKVLHPRRKGLLLPRTGGPPKDRMAHGMAREMPPTNRITIFGRFEYKQPRGFDYKESRGSLEVQQ